MTTKNIDFISKHELIKRLAKSLGVSIEISDEIFKGLGDIYLEMIQNNESFRLPGVGTIEVMKKDINDIVYYPKTKTYGPRINKRSAKFKASDELKRRLKV